MIFQRQNDDSYMVEIQPEEIIYDHYADTVVLQMVFSGDAIQQLAQDDNARVAMVRDFAKFAGKVLDEGRAKAAERQRVTVGSGEILRAAKLDPEMVRRINAAFDKGMAQGPNR